MEQAKVKGSWRPNPKPLKPRERQPYFPYSTFSSLCLKSAGGSPMPLLLWSRGSLHGEHLSHKIQSTLQDSWTYTVSTRLDQLGIPLQWDPEPESYSAVAISWPTSSTFLQLPGFSSRLRSLSRHWFAYLCVFSDQESKSWGFFQKCAIGRSQREAGESKITSLRTEKTTTSSRAGPRRGIGQ